MRFFLHTVSHACGAIKPPGGTAIRHGKIRLDDKNVLVDGVPEKMVNVIVKLMQGWKTRLEVTEDGNVLTSRKINIRKGFLQGDSYSPVGLCLTEVPISMLIEETDRYRMGQTKKKSKKHSLFIDDLKIYQESHRKLEVVNEMIVKASLDTGACYRVKKMCIKVK